MSHSVLENVTRTSLHDTIMVYRLKAATANLLSTRRGKQWQSHR